MDLQIYTYYGSCLLKMDSPTFNFDPVKHEYTVGNLVIPGITTVLKIAADYSSMISNEVMEYAANRGKAIHAAVQYDNENDLDVDSLDSKIRPYFDAWLDFKENRKFNVLGFEEPMYSQQYMFASLPDLWGYIDGDEGHIILPELKSTSQILPQVALQTAAQQHLILTNKGKATVRGVLQLKKNGKYKFEFYKSSVDRRDFSIFKSCIQIYNWRKENGIKD